MEKGTASTENELLFEIRFNEIRNRFGGVWHISTPGTFQEIIFTDSEDFKFGMSCMALTKAETGYVEKRNVMFSRMREYPKEYQYRNGVILPNSYCDYKLGEGLFLNPHQYFSLLMKNVESYKEIASSIAESVSLTDEEVYSTAMMIAEKNYGSRKLNLLSPTQKIELAKTLHYDYHTPNAQLRRILKISDSILNSLWPLSALANQ